MGWNRFLGASVNCCRIEEISAFRLSLECRSLARRRWHSLAQDAATLFGFTFAASWAMAHTAVLPYIDGVPR